jgi:group I intron endonuclease
LEYLTGYVYKIVNRANGKSYVGQTVVSLKQRLNTHFSKHSRCARLKSAIESHGKENFDIVLLNTVTAETRSELSDRLNSLEKSYIKSINTLHPNGYNLTDGGDRASMNQETRDRITAAHWKPIKCNETGQEWKSIKACADSFGVKLEAIHRVLRGVRGSFRKMTFSYLPKQS